MHQGTQPTTAVLIALLYLRIVERECDPDTRLGHGAPPDLNLVTAEVLEPDFLHGDAERGVVAEVAVHEEQP